ncbi:MAG: nicotinamide riboside transporter PnuC [Bacteroidales bacterium]|nr:nicotinamide riboside transporter PnuC [Bacteroidales bacterium]
MEIFNIENPLFTLLGYGVPLLEFVGVILGICSVYLATRGKAINFLLGAVGMSFLAVFLFQKGLYSSMILQIILVCFCIYGYYSWTKPKKDEETTASHQKKVTVLTNQQRIFLAVGLLTFVAAWGSMMLFAKPDFLRTIFTETYDRLALGYFDAFILIAATTGMYLRTQKKLENWFVFLSSDTAGIILFTLSGAYFMVLMCSIYWLLDIKGILGWRKEMKSYANN